MGDSAALLKRARELFQQGFQQQAEEIVERILRESPHDTTALDFRGYLLYRKGGLDDALAVYGRLAELEPGAAGHCANIGLICFKLQRYHEARQAFERLLELQPGDVRALRNLGYCLERLRDPEQALECFVKAGDEEQAERIRERLARSATAGLESVGPFVADGRAPAPPGGVPSPRGETVPETEVSAWLARASLPRSGRGPDLARAGSGELLIKVRGKVFLNPAFCIGHRGVMVFAPASRDAEKASAKFGDRHGVLARAEGNGELVLSGLGRGLQALHLGGGRLCVNWGSLVLCGTEIALSFEHAGLVKEAFLATGLAGSGTVVLAVRGAPIVLPVTPELPTLARPEAVVAWTDGLGYEAEIVPELKKLVGKREALRYRFEGKGHLVLQSC